jgi:putative acetyltransferase
MNPSFKLSPFAPRMVSSSEWPPVQHGWCQIRSYCEADFYPCLAVWVKASWRAHGFLGLSTWLKQAWRLWRDQLGSAAKRVYVQQGAVCGFVAVQPRHHIVGLFVEPGRQRMGIGSKLEAHAHELAELYSVDVYSLNLPARQFYEHLGFRFTDVCPADADGAPYALLRMTRLPSTPPNPTASPRYIS